MNEFFVVDINIVAGILLSIIIYIAYKTLDKTDKVNRIFLTLSFLVVLEIFLETFVCFIDGIRGYFLKSIYYFSCFTIFIMAPFLSYLWFTFIKYWVSPSKKEIFHRSIFLGLPILLNFFLVVTSMNNGNVFYIDSENIYHRGPLFLLTVLISYTYLFLGCFWVISHRKKILKGELLPFLTFGFFPLLGGVIQVLFYKILLIWSSAAFSLVIVYIFLQKRMVHLDYLTGAWTRESFFGYFHQRYEESHGEVPMIFVDIDNLKTINDEFGHIEGDFAIKKAVHIIKNSLRKTDIITRYGGDEFLITLDIEKAKDVERILERINRSFEKYNRYSNKKYELSVTFGHGTYSKSYETLEKFISVIDNKMYENKRIKKVVFE